MNYTIYLRSEHVALALAGPEHAELCFAWMNDIEVTRYTRRTMPLSLADEKAYLERIYASPLDVSFLILIKDRPDEDLLNEDIPWKPIGMMGLHKIDYLHQSAETGAIIGDTHCQGRGYGTEAKVLLLKYAFDQLNLRTIISHVYGSNSKSLAYSKKCGYEVAGCIPKYAFRMGVWEDEYTLYVTREQFLKALKKLQSRKTKSKK